MIIKFLIISPWVAIRHLTELISVPNGVITQPCFQRLPRCIDSSKTRSIRSDKTSTLIFKHNFRSTDFGLTGMDAICNLEWCAIAPGSTHVGRPQRSSPQHNRFSGGKHCTIFPALSQTDR